MPFFKKGFDIMASLPQRKDGRYYSRVNIGRADNGSIRYKYFYGTTQKEVKEQVRAFTTDLDTYGKSVDNSKITLQDWGYTHLFTNIKPNVQNSTFEIYIIFYNCHIKDSRIGKLPIKDIQQIHIQNYFNDNKHLSKSTMKTLRYLIKAFFKSAISNNLTRTNPVDGMKLPISDVDKKQIDIMTLDEQKAYIEALKGTKLRVLYLTALYTGMRQGEIVALKWDNVDLKNNTIKVCESYKIVKHFNEDGSSSIELDKKSPKTESGNRIISIPASLSNELKKYKLSSTNNNDNLVFCEDNGKSLKNAKVAYYHKMNCKYANIRHVVFHALRHTFATRMIENGVDVKTVSETLGHKDILITLNTYVHSTEDTKKASAEIMDKLFKSMSF